MFMHFYIEEVSIVERIIRRTEMKKHEFKRVLACAMALTLIMSGCGNGATNTQGTAEASESTVETSEIITEASESGSEAVDAAGTEDGQSSEQKAEQQVSAEEETTTVEAEESLPTYEAITVNPEQCLDKDGKATTASGIVIDIKTQSTDGYPTGDLKEFMEYNMNRYSYYDNHTYTDVADFESDVNKGIAMMDAYVSTMPATAFDKCKTRSEVQVLIEEYITEKYGWEEYNKIHESAAMFAYEVYVDAVADAHGVNEKANWKREHEQKKPSDYIYKPDDTQPQKPTDTTGGDGDTTGGGNGGGSSWGGTPYDENDPWHFDCPTMVLEG